MERDFMGLNSQDSVVSVKEEVVDESCKDSGYARTSGVQRPLSNKASFLHHFTAFKSEQDEKPSKLNSDHVASHGCIAKSSPDVFENLGGASMKQQFLGRNPLAGITEQWINSKVSSVPSQLTIFYAGTVSVFDEISPEKAQAIMFFAGNGCVRSNVAKAPVSRLPPAERTVANVRPGSGLPSPISVSSHPIDQSSVAPANDNYVQPSTIGMSTTLANKVEPQKMISSLGSVAATAAMMSSAIPQSRKASLARFLEKRKERVMNAAPYNLSKKANESPTPESNGSGFSASSMSTNKETSAGN